MDIVEKWPRLKEALMLIGCVDWHSAVNVVCCVELTITSPDPKSWYPPVNRFFGEVQGLPPMHELHDSCRRRAVRNALKGLQKWHPITPALGTPPGDDIALLENVGPLIWKQPDEDWTIVISSYDGLMPMTHTGEGKSEQLAVEKVIYNILSPYF